MPPNVVQSPQVPAAQASIVQPQQPTTLTTNEPAETPATNQEAFAVSIIYYKYLVILLILVKGVIG